MTKVLYLCPGVPSVSDPLGSAPWAEQTPTLVEAEIVRDNGDGTFAVRIGRSIIGDATEGTGVRQWRQLSGITAADLAQLRLDVVGLMQDADPSVKLAARALAAAVAAHDVRQTAIDLRAAALNTGLSSTLRALAIVALGVVVAEERTR